METVQMGLAYLILSASLLLAVLPAGGMMGGFGWGAGVVELIPMWIRLSAAGGRVAIEPAGGGGPGLCVAGPWRTVFFDKGVSFPERRVLYPALFVYGPTSLAR